MEKKLEQLKGKDSGAFERHYNELYEKLGCEEGSTYKFLQPELANTQGDVACEKVVIAIPREPLDFMQRAVEIGHPRSIAIQLPPALQEVMAWNRDAEAFEIYKHRIDFVKHWTERAKGLAEADLELLKKAPPHLQQILKGKRLALWQAMLEHYDYPDKELVNDIVQGFPVTGWLPDSQVFPKDFKPPSMSVETLESLSKGFNERVRAKVMASSTSESGGSHLGGD